MSRSNNIAKPPISTNRFDFLRLLFASLVFVFHAVVLVSIWPNMQIESTLAELAEISIQGFFVISGTLVYGSYLNSKNVGDYLNKRLRRLYPAYAVIIIIPALISLAISGEMMEVIKHIGVNLVFLNFLNPDLPGLFEGHRYSEVNGALWTLKIEVMFYIALPVLGWVLAKIGTAKWGLLIAIYIGAELWRSIWPQLDLPYNVQIARQLPGQMSFFAVGMILWIFRDLAKQKAVLLGCIGVALLITSHFQYLEFIRPLALGGIVAGIAYAPGITLNAARWGDISYGVYITHFPILNGLIALGVFAFNPWFGFSLSIFLVVAASMLLWKLVERPFLRRDSHYRRAETEGS